MNSAARFVALRHRNFRLLWWGQLISFSGSMMQTAAILWHVSLLVPASRKGLALGMVGLVRVVPIIVFSLISGVVADALDRRRLMLATQTSMAVLAGILALLTFRGLGLVWPIYLLAALGSAAGSFDGPARQALIPNLVPREHLPSAISLKAAWEGLRFVFSSPMIRSTMLLDFFATFFSSATALLPIFAQDILRVGATGYGWLYAAPAAGALVTSAAMVPLTERIDRRGVTLLWAVGWF